MRRLKLSLLLLSSVLIVPACETVAVGVATPMVVKKRHLNLTNASYAGIEALVVQTPNQKIDPLRPFILQNLEEVIHEPDKTGVLPRRKVYRNPRLVEVMAEQMSSRLQTLGYRVLDTQSPPSTGLPPYIVFGTFHLDNGDILERRGTMQVALQMRDPSNDRIISTHTYFVPVTDEVREYMDSRNVFVPGFLRD